MANKYSKSNNSTAAKEEKTMAEYRERRAKMDKGARVMAIVLVVVMVVFALVGSIAFLL